MYKDLKKIFHLDAGEAESVYKARLADESAVVLKIGSKDFFYWFPPDVYSLLLKIERADRQVNALVDAMPRGASEKYMFECVVDEIILTNDIEGVVSTRKEIELAMDALRKNDKNRRFQGIVNKYVALASSETVNVETCEDIRAIYDDIVYDEVVAEGEGKIPDGRLFRTDSVRVVDAAQRIIHENNMSESEIAQELQHAIAIYNDTEVEPLVRAAIFHFIFGYVHPFYDGNGRTNRFISSALVCREASRWSGIRLSFSVKENINAYYNAFKTVEHPLNRGDLTPFVITFLEIVLHALDRTYESLLQKSNALCEMRESLALRCENGAELDLDGVGEALLHATLFASKGFAVEEIAREVGISEPTVYKRLEAFKRSGLLVREKFGRKVYYRLDAGLCLARRE